MNQLPKSFLYGAALSSHQVEGNTIYSDWWHEEQQGKVPKSGQAADHYNRYIEDFALAEQIGLNALRISIEWSRIEPQPGHWNMEAVEHYKKVLMEMKQRGLTRMVTLHHYTLPLWAYDKGGFNNTEIIFAFRRYAEFIAKHLGEEIDLWNTINEPEVYVNMSSLVGVWPPFSRNPIRAHTVFNNLAKAHIEAYRTIKKVLPNAQIGMAKNNVYNEAAHPHSWLDQKFVQLNNWFTNYWFLDKIKNHIDFIGLNYYFYYSLTASWKKIGHLNKKQPKSDMGWRTFPEGIYHVLTALHERYGKPVYITENGIANAREDMRQDFIREHLHWTEKAIDSGVDVRGYFYWALTDTYEWTDAYNVRFGLIEIDFANFKRTVRSSAQVFKELRK